MSLLKKIRNQKKRSQKIGRMIWMVIKDNKIRFHLAVRKGCKLLGIIIGNTFVKAPA